MHLLSDRFRDTRSARVGDQVSDATRERTAPLTRLTTNRTAAFGAPGGLSLPWERFKAVGGEQLTLRRSASSRYSTAQHISFNGIEPWQNHC
jgi:hypothetical protein